MDKKRFLLIFFGICLLFSGMYLVSYNYLKTKIDSAYDKMNLQLISLNNELEQENNEFLNDYEQYDNDEFTYLEIDEVVLEREESVDRYENYYIARLRIPKISLDKGIVDINSKYNNVNKNIQIIKGSNYPDVSNGNLILAAHAGTSSVSYFKNLYKLSKGDKCYVDYKGKTYTYNIVNIYYQEKDGNIAIYRDYSKNTLTLVTCTKNNKYKQTVYIAELISVK